MRWILITVGLVLGSSLPLMAQAPLDFQDEAALEAWARSWLEELEEADLSSPSDHGSLERLWAYYLLAVARKDEETRAVQTQRSLAGKLPTGTPMSRTVAAIGGALEVLRGRNSRWPPNKLEHVDRGLEILDALVREDPTAPDLRYLRLMSTYYLPFFFDRDESVAADMMVLTRELSGNPGPFPPEIHEAAVAFVLENGTISEADRVRLGEILR